MTARFVINVFKVILIAMVLVFFIDIVIYLVKAYQLRQRIESVMVSMQRTVMQNNYLPESEYDTYSVIFDTITNTLNGSNIDDDNKFGRDRKAAMANRDSFIFTNGTGTGGITMNYDPDIHAKPDVSNAYTKLTVGSDSTTIYDPTTPESVNLATPAEYGDLKFIQVSVTLIRPIWGFVTQGTKWSAWQNNADNDNTEGIRAENGVSDLGKVTLHFSYLVPCLHYNAIT